MVPNTSHRISQLRTIYKKLQEKEIALGLVEQDDTGYQWFNRKNMKDRRYKAIEKLYDDAKREMIHKQHYGSWE